MPLLAAISCIEVSINWDVPFRPHAAVEFQVCLQACHMPALKATGYTNSCLDEGSGVPRPPDPSEIHFLLKSTSDQDRQWGGFMHWLELETCSDGAKGRGWNLPAVHKPLVPTGANDFPWVNSLMQNTMADKGWQLLLQHLDHPHFNLAEEDDEAREFRQQLKQVLTQDGPLEVEALHDMLSFAKALDKTYQQNQKLKYQQWLEKATEGGMRGLYRTLKKPETKLVLTGTSPWTFDRTSDEKTGCVCGTRPNGTTMTCSQCWRISEKEPSTRHSSLDPSPPSICLTSPMVPTASRPPCSNTPMRPKLRNSLPTSIPGNALGACRIVSGRV